MSDQYNIVIADDDPVLRRMLQQSLERCPGSHVLAALANKKDLIASVKEQNPHLIITDLQMPDGLEGFEAISELRQSGIKTPAIITTGRLYMLEELEIFTRNNLDYNPARQESSTLEYIELLNKEKETQHIYGMAKPYHPQALCKLMDIIRGK